VEQERDAGAVVLLRALLCAAASAAAAVVAARGGGRPLDVLLWAVLAPLVVAALLELAARAQREAHGLRHRAQVVVPDEAPDTAPDAAPDHASTEPAPGRQTTG
jgi:hypothetical protein